MEQFEFKGTKGEWFSCCLHAKPHYCFANDDTTICGFYKKQEMREDLPDEELRANALLISKAPEMLEMLKNIFNDYDYAHDNRKQIEQLLKEATEL